MKSNSSFISLFKIAILIFVCYYLCLKFIYPGYFDPSVPYHADNYVYYTSAIDFHIGGDLFKQTRFVSTIVMSLFADFNFQVFNLCLIGIVLLNIGLTIYFVKLLSGKTKLSMVFVFIYLISIFAHPEFYSNYWFDIYNTIAYFFMINTLIAWLKYKSDQRFIFKILPFVTIFLCFFSKETYVLVLLFFWGYQWFYEKEYRRYLSLLILYTIFMYGLVFFQSSFITNSPFINSEANNQDTYYISVNPISIVKTYWFYLKHFTNPFTLVTLIAAFAINFMAKTNWNKMILLFGMGLLTYAPNAVLPNHLFNFYAWLAAPLSFSLIMLVEETYFSHRLFNRRSLMVGAAILAFLSIVWNHRSYHSQTSVWILSQEQINRHMLNNFPFIQQQIQPGDHVLVIGATSSFNPFKASKFIDRSFNHIHKSYWTIGVTNESEEKAGTYISKKTLEHIHIQDYDKIFVFDEKGYLANFMTREQIKSISDMDSSSLEMNQVDISLIPELMEAQKKLAANPDDTQTLMQVGSSFLQNKVFNKAGFYLERALSLELKKTEAVPNPYLYFYLGNVKENEAKYAQAMELYQKALTGLNNEGQTNAYFNDAVERMKQQVTK
ncbi:hypothetical protein B5M42_011815 [Paenibacillus athensensis]|uniref:Uncharacterized protein n=1 Tax=Paenibacillus athensensis TaxID=1967502 RepID=A0A4Y8Q5F1_9BACL|nr:hypothetical protein [Paenibacillus athensensis]MCD1259517.1 hypothetical protein [Paenibacillus athensensis]